MSRLFEALQVSASEKSGGAPAEELTLVNDMFQAKEGKPHSTDDWCTLRVAPSPESRLVSLVDRRSLGAEKFRLLAVRLREMQQAKGLKRILITSTIAEEGKSVISANLAITLARRHQQRVLLIEGDLRRPTLLKQFGLCGLPGLSESLASNAGMRANLYFLEEPHLWFIPAGQQPENPLELMQSERLSELLSLLCSAFDWVVIDSPPLLPLADTTVWSRVSDGIILVAREGVTEMKALKRGLEAVSRTNLVGVVLNSCTDVDHGNYYHRYAPSLPQASLENIS